MHDPLLGQISIKGLKFSGIIGVQASYRDTRVPFNPRNKILEFLQRFAPHPDEAHFGVAGVFKDERYEVNRLRKRWRSKRTANIHVNDMRPPFFDQAPLARCLGILRRTACYAIDFVGKFSKLTPVAAFLAISSTTDFDTCPNLRCQSSIPMLLFFRIRGRATDAGIAFSLAFGIASPASSKRLWVCLFVAYPTTSLLFLRSVMVHTSCATVVLSPC